MRKETIICSRCVMDTSDPDILFDEKGYCNHCTRALDILEKKQFFDAQAKSEMLQAILADIKLAGKNKKYDCVIGLSGGVDSSYLAYYVVRKLGLRPLAVHLDNGWNSELAVMNIENLVKKLDLDLYTWVIDWEVFRDLQLAYLKASVIDLEVLSDNAIVIAIHKVLKKHGLKYFLIGHNYAAESVMPASWLFSPKFDSLNIREIYRRFGSGKKLKTYPLLNFAEFIHYLYFDKSRAVNILDLIDYNKDEAISVLESEMGWRNYGGKHYESTITKFYQAYILPQKFGVDKRKAHLSSLICSGQITRDQALEELKEPLYDDISLKREKEFFLKKLGLSSESFDSIMLQPPVPHLYYKSYTGFIRRVRKYIHPLLPGRK